MVMLVHRYKIAVFTKQKYRVVHVKPPKEADCQNTTLWKLNTTIYRLSDASRSWYLNFEKELIRLDAIICESLIQLYLYGIINQK